MLDDSSKATHPRPDKTRLYLPGSATSATSNTVAGVPVNGNVAIRSSSNIRLSLALVMLSLVAVTALVLGVLFAVVPMLAQPKHNSSPPITQKPTATGATSPQPTQTVAHATATSMATQTQLVQGTLTIAGLTVVPDHFTTPTDCQIDNGYRCTVTLLASGDIDSTIHWRASSEGVVTKFSPTSGRLKAGDQQQVIVYIYNGCPYNGTLIFTVAGKHLMVPVNC